MITLFTQGCETKAWYVVYKAVFCLYFLSSIIYTWVMDYQHHSHTSNSWKYIIWMTHWGICLICGALCLETVITVMLFMKKNVNVRIMLFSWALTTMTYTMAVLITFLFWVLLYNWKSPPTYGNLYVHGLQVKLEFMMFDAKLILFDAGVVCHL